MSAKTIPSGTRFGKLEVLSEAPSKIFKSKRYPASLLLCDCGKETIVLNQHLKPGGTRSCGCGKGYIIHGKYRSPTYITWANMIQRCENTVRRNHERYGGRGIRVCERWHKFEDFFADMGERPPGKSMDRIDNDGNYEPENCRWATRTEQQRNKRTNRVFTVHGITGCLTELCERFNIAHDTARWRIKKGWSPDRAFTEPVHVKYRGGGRLHGPIEGK